MNKIQTLIIAIHSNTGHPNKYLMIGKISTIYAAFAFMLISFNSPSLNAQGLHSEFSSIKGEDDDSKKHFYLFGLTTLNSTEKVTETLGASQQFQARFIIHHLDLDTSPKFKRGFATDVVVNAINLKPNKVSKDSLDLVSLMFPESGNTGFSITPKWYHLGQRSADRNTQWFFSSEFSLSLRQNKIQNVLEVDSAGATISNEDINFSAINLNFMPIKYTYLFNKKKDDDETNAQISAGVYLNYFNIPNEDVGNFNRLFPSDNPIFSTRENSRIWSIGTKISLSINGFGFFIDLRNNFNGDLTDDNPFKGFVFNSGFTSSLAIFKR